MHSVLREDGKAKDSKEGETTNKLHQMPPLDSGANL